MFRRLFLLGMLLVVVLTTSRVQAAQADGPRTYGLGSLTGMALSPDGTRLTALTRVGVYWYDAASFGLTDYWATSGEVAALKWSPARDVVLVITSREVQVRAAAAGTLLWSVPLSREYYYTRSAAYSPDGAWVAVANGETMTVRHATSGEVAFTLDRRVNSNGRSSYYRELRFLPDGSALYVCCGVAGPVWVDMHTWQVTAAPELPYSRGRLSPDGTLTAIAGGAVYIYDTASGRLLGQSDAVEETWSLAFSPNGAQLATGHGNGLVRIWGLAGGVPTLQFILRGHRAYADSLAWSPDGRTLYSAGANTIRAWDAATGAQLRLIDGFTAAVNFITWSADGTRLIAQQGQQLGAWDAASGQPVQAALLPEVTFKYNSWWVDDQTATARAIATELAASPTGDLLAEGDLYGVTLHNAATLAPVRRLPTGYRVIVTVFSPDGRYLATAGNSPFVVVWDVATGNPVHALLGSANNYWNVALAFAPDGRSLYTLENNGILRDWDLATESSTAVQTPAPVCRRYCYNPIDPAIHPGTGVVASEGNATVNVSNIATGQATYSFTAERPAGIIINAQGTRVAAIVQGAARIWSLTDGAALATYSGPAAGYSDLAFSPDGAALAASSAAGLVQVWRVP